MSAVRSPRAFFAAASLASLAAIAGCTPDRPAPPPAAPVVAAPAPPPKPQPVAFVEDDLAAATARAAKEKKALFVDVWAPWCHTCLSMKNFVLSSPDLAPLAELAVFASIDFDKPDSAPFVEKYKVRGQPNFLVDDPTSGDVLGTWLGSGSTLEDKSMVELATARGPADGPIGAFRLGCQARAQGKHDAAAAAYGRAFALGGSGFALRHEALLGWLEELDQSGDHAGCAREAVAHEADLRGSSVPSDAAITALGAAEHLDGDAKTATRAFAVRVLRGFVDQPPEGATVDDRGDASATLAEALEQGGDAPGARAVRERWLAMLEKAAREAQSLEAAHTFDYPRANALVALDRANDAVRMLEERMKELPTDYEPFARLASACIKANRYGDALPAIRRAIELSYGPRRLRYMATEAKILGAIGEYGSQVDVLEREVTGWAALPAGQASAPSLADAQKRLDAAKKAATAKPAVAKKP